MSITIEVNLPSAIHLRNRDGAPVNLDVEKLPAHVIGRIFEAGAKVILTNAFNGGGKDKPEADRYASMEAKMKAWYNGDFAVVERGDSWMSVLKEQYISEQVSLGAKPSVVEANIKDLVTSTFGEGEKATFSRFLDAVATHLAKDSGEPYEEVRGQIEADLSARAEEAERARADAAKKVKVDVKGLALAAFRKPQK